LSAAKFGFQLLETFPYKASIDILNRSGVTYKCDRRTGGQMPHGRLQRG